MNRSTASIAELLGVPKKVALEFFATFARFEYALKRGGYVQGDERRAWADWDRFARDLAGLEPKHVDPVLSSSRYLLEHPPKKQVLIDGRLQWMDRAGGAGSTIGDLLLNVRTVRNNVFHGGKFPEGPIDEPLRDGQLVADCLSVLDGLLQLPLPNRVAEHFWSEA